MAEGNIQQVRLSITRGFYEDLMCLSGRNLNSFSYEGDKNIIIQLSYKNFSEIFALAGENAWLVPFFFTICRKSEVARISEKFLFFYT